MSLIFLIAFRYNVCSILIGNNRPISLDDTREYSELPKCAQSPFLKGCDSVDCHTNDCFCRPDLMAHAMDSVRSGASAACSGIAPAGVNSALAVIKLYCSRNGFTATTLGSEATGTVFVSSSPTPSPGAVSFFGLTNISICKLITVTHSRCIFQRRSCDSISVFNSTLNK